MDETRRNVHSFRSVLPLQRDVYSQLQQYLRDMVAGRSARPDWALWLEEALGLEARNVTLEELRHVCAVVSPYVSACRQAVERSCMPTTWAASGCCGWSRRLV